MKGYVKRLSQKVSRLSNEQLISLIDTLVDENENLYSIFESISTGIVILDNNFILQQSNLTAESYLPLSIHFDDSKAQNLPFWELLDDVEITDFIKNSYSKEITNSTEDFTIKTSGGRIRFLSISINPFILHNELSGRILLIHDITEKKNQDVRLHRMENLANLTNLAAGMAHEIKNPLGAISIHIQLIQKALKKARENNDILPGKKFVEDHIDVVNEEVEHLNQLIMDFLLAVRPVNATLELKDPAKLILNMVEFFKPEMIENNIDVQLKTPEKSAKILLDERLLREVIINLSQNALAAIKTKSKDNPDYKGFFSIECGITENKYAILVRDNGCGMNDETVSKIFEPYYTTKATGTGLGMTMVYKIIKEFSGEIQVKSEPGEGTLFIMIFPLPQSNKKLITQTGN